MLKSLKMSQKKTKKEGYCLATQTLLVIDSQNNMHVILKKLSGKKQTTPFTVVNIGAKLFTIFSTLIIEDVFMCYLGEKLALNNF